MNDILEMLSSDEAAIVELLKRRGIHTSIHQHVLLSEFGERVICKNFDREDFHGTAVALGELRICESVGVYHLPYASIEALMDYALSEQMSHCSCKCSRGDIIDKFLSATIFDNEICLLDTLRESTENEV